MSLQGRIAFVLIVFFSVFAGANDLVELEPPMKADEAMALEPIDITNQSEEAEGFCDIIYPGEKGLDNRYCREGYGVTYDGYFANNSCYRSRQDARQVMRSLRACRFDKTRDNCSFSYPDRHDRSRRFCDNRWGISYRGYINNNTCYVNIDDALDSWERTRACVRRPRIGRCHIAFPRVRDANGRYCNNGFGILFRGEILRNACWRNVDDAFANARQMRECRR